MERKILIKNENYTEKIEKKELRFFEKNQKNIYLTGKNYVEGVDETVDCRFVNLEDLLIERLETKNLYLKVFNDMPVLSRDLKLNFKEVKVKNDFYVEADVEFRSYIEIEDLKGCCEILAKFEEIKAKNFDRVFFRVCNNRRVIKKINLKGGKGVIFLPLRGETKKVKINEINIENVENVDLEKLKIEKGKLSIKDVRKLLLNESFLENFDGEISCKYLYFDFKKAEALEKLREMMKKNKISFENLMLDRDIEEESIRYEIVLNKKINITYLLKIRNVEKRRIIAEFTGGLKEALKYEKNLILIDKNEKGELYRVSGERGEVRFLRYKDVSTEREYISFVPPNINSVNEGFAWKFNITKEEYQSLTAES